MMLYFNAAVDDEWNTTGNWWEDYLCTVPAGTTSDDTVPTAYDDVTIIAGVVSTYGPAPVAYTLVAPSTAYVNLNSLHVLAYALFADGAAFGGSMTCDGPVEFRGASTANAGTITGNCFFSEGVSSGNAPYNGGPITGDCEFGPWAYNSSTITGDCLFSGNYSTNDGSIIGDVVFSGEYSMNSMAGTITGTVDFTLGSAVVNEGIINGDVAFGGSSANNGTINGNVTFEANSINSAMIVGNASFFGGSAYNGGSGIVDGSAYFYGDAYNNGIINFGFFYGSSIHFGNANGARFYDDSSNRNGSVSGVAYFHSASSVITTMNIANENGVAPFNGVASLSMPFADVLGTGLL